MFSARTPLRTERLVLRRFTRDDVTAIAAALNDYAVSQWLTVVPFPYAEADARSFVDSLDPRAAPLEGFGIYDATGLVGGIGIDGHMGYWLAQHAWGRGYATEAAGAMVHAFFETTEAQDLISGYFEGNAASAQVLAKLGFRHSFDERVKSCAQGVEVTLKNAVLRQEDWAARAGARGAGNGT